MCDTIVATPEFTITGNMIFGKNSHREPNEAQALIRIPAQDHTAEKLRATYINIPQVKTTHEVILSKPFQMWGAEMGANEHNLAIGNEAVFTRIKFDKQNPGLTGMDMVRVALERCANSEAALELITELLETYGQDACGGYHDRNFYYHNSFIIADPREAYLLETAGRHWVALKIKGFRSISNGLTIGENFDYASEGLIDFARKEGYLKKNADFHFTRVFSDKFYTYFSKCKIRQALSMSRGEERQGRLDASSAMTILRDHGASEKNGVFHPGSSDTGALCTHAAGLSVPHQTTGSLVSELRENSHSTHWFTGTAATCLSLYKPFFIPGTNIKQGEFLEPGPVVDESLWWRHERLHRYILKNYPKRSELIRAERDELEGDFLGKAQVLAKKNGSESELEEFSRESFTLAEKNLTRKLAEIEKLEADGGGGEKFTPIYSLYRRGLDRDVGI